MFFCPLPHLTTRGRLWVHPREHSLYSALYLFISIAAIIYLIHHCFIFLHSFRHLREISELQAHQRGEVELLYRRLGKAPPQGVGLSPVSPHTCPRKRSNKHKLKPSKLLSPLVQQFKNVKTRSSDSSRSSVCFCENRHNFPAPATSEAF